MDRAFFFFRRRGVLYASAFLALAIPLGTWLLVASPPPQTVVVPVAYVAGAVESAVPADPAAAERLGRTRLAERDPLALCRQGRERYEREIRDYRCVLLKQERLDAGLSPVQEVEVRFRKDPKSVYMLWRANEDQVRRALFIDRPEFRDDQGQPLARVEPAGAVVRLLVKDLMMPIHGDMAEKASRRTIDECGFGAMFEILERFNRLATEKGVLEFASSGAGTVDGRPTFVLTRFLPYTGPKGTFPDAKMVMHLDQEWLLPVAIYSYADRDGKELLGSYVFTKVELNPALGDDAFQF